jgi:hypothetical protein
VYSCDTNAITKETVHQSYGLKVHTSATNLVITLKLVNSAVRQALIINSGFPYSLQTKPYVTEHKEHCHEHQQNCTAEASEQRHVFR